MNEINESKRDELNEVTAEELEAVEGGLNPQPLPPRIAFVQNEFVQYALLFQAR
jgi:hypothetical protein